MQSQCKLEATTDAKYEKKGVISPGQEVSELSEALDSVLLHS